MDVVAVESERIPVAAAEVDFVTDVFVADVVRDGAVDRVACDEDEGDDCETRKRK